MKNPPANAEDKGEVGSNPGLRRYYVLQLGNPHVERSSEKPQQQLKVQQLLNSRDGDLEAPGDGRGSWFQMLMRFHHV